MHRRYLPPRNPTPASAHPPCRAGVQTCNSGTWSSCNGAIAPAPDRCGDNVDNDCDGVVDLGCGTGGDGGVDASLDGHLDGGAPDAGVRLCGNGVTCPSGQVRLGGMCQADPCIGNTMCAAGQSCLATCVPLRDPCDGVTCPDQQTCVSGDCVAGCFDVPCAGVTCPDGQYCDRSTRGAACRSRRARIAAATGTPAPCSGRADPALGSSVPRRALPRWNVRGQSLRGRDVWGR